MIAMKWGMPLAACLSLLCVAPVQAQQANMSFFVTSHGPGKGADLGGLAGADKHCQDLAASVGAGGKTWHAYLSTQGAGAVNAQATGSARVPGMNAKGVVVAKDVAELHGTNGLTKQTALSEKGEVINGRGDKPNRHDILTGSQPDGTAFTDDKDHTCKNWTSSTQGSAMVGHADRIGLARRCSPRIPGIRRIPRAGLTAAARKTICAQPAVTGCCIASPRIRRRTHFAARGHRSRRRHRLARLAKQRDAGSREVDCADRSLRP